MEERGMRKAGAWAGLLMGALCVLAMPAAYAVDVQGGVIGSGEYGYAIRTTVVNSAAGKNGARSGMNNVLPKDTSILGFKLIALAATANCDLYDATSVQGADDSTVIDELAEVSANGTAIQMWPNPYRVKTALSVGALNAVCIIYTR